jgi:hypothetical protein
MASVNEWLALAHRVLGVGLKFQAIYVPVRGPRSSSVHVCGMSIVARSVSNLRGILALIDAGLVTEARKLLLELTPLNRTRGGLRLVFDVFSR